MRGAFFFYLVQSCVAFASPTLYVRIKNTQAIPDLTHVLTRLPGRAPTARGRDHGGHDHEEEEEGQGQQRALHDFVGTGRSKLAQVEFKKKKLFGKVRACPPASPTPSLRVKVEFLFLPSSSPSSSHLRLLPLPPSLSF